MARYSDNTIPNMGTDWSFDPSTGLPFSGRSVQAFIKSQLNNKASAGWFDSREMTLYLFKDDAAKEEFKEDTTRMDLVIASIPFNFELTQYRIRVTPVGSTTTNATINQEEVRLEMGLQAESRELGEATWRPTGQDIGVRVYVDLNSTGSYDEIPALAQTVLSSVGNLSVDVKPYISTGTSRVRFYFYAANDPSLSTSIVWNITMAEMYIEEWGNTWYQALVEDGNVNNYHLGGFKIVGTIVKTLHIEISTTQSIVASYARDIGSMEAIESPFFFSRNEGLDLSAPVSRSGDSLPPLATGIYNVKVWLTSGNLSTEDNAILYSIMYIASGDEYNAKLVVMNNAGREVNNYDESAHLCDYAIYNAGASSGSPVITITPYIAGTAGSTTTIETEVFTETKQVLNHNINLVTNSTNLTIRYRVTMTDNYQEDVSRVDNSEIFPAEDGAAFYLNTSLRSNGEQAKETIFNTANGNQVALSAVEWQKMSWVDGIDGWTEDDEGRKCLFLPARTRLTIPPSAFRFLTGENITFELCYKVANVSDYTENIMTFAQNPTSEGFMGIRIKPTNVTVHSGSDSTASNDIYQGTNIADEETVHLVITIQNSFGSNSGYNIVTGYVNGCKNFQFSYTSGTIWANTYANAIFGSDTADLYLYSLRFYGKALAASGAENNWLNSLTTRSEKVLQKAFLQSVLKASSRQIDYETIKNNGKYNFFVVEMTSGSANVPSTSYPDGGRSNIEMHYGVDSQGNSRSHWDWKIYDVETKGQGTTSMNYWLWNIRWRIDKTDDSKKRMVAYYNDPIISAGVKTFDEQTPVSSKVVWFDGEANHPAVKRITAKINFASSMQSHKMGATRAYSLLHDGIENGALLNEAQQEAESQGLPAPSVAVYQYPAFGFQKNVDSLGTESYSFIGLFTIGPDKGDKPTFGWDLVEDDLVSLEGTDHTPQLAKFNVPWDEQTVYYVNGDGDAFLATKAPQGNYVGALEIGNAKTADTKKPAEGMPVMESSFKNAYSVVYDNSTLIVPIALDDETYGDEDAEHVLANINADIENFQKISYDGRLSYADMEFWIEGEYVLYHYEYESQQYVSGYKSSGSYGSPLNLLTDTGITSSELEDLTLEQQNELFKEARRARFLANAPAYWDMRELAFNYVYLLVFAATDNFAKNQYPYYMGGKWRFRQDDLDTIEDIDNNGGQTKPSDIEFEDAIGGSPYFAGSNSVLWNLVHETMWSDFTVSSVDYPGIRTMGKEMIELMSELSGGDNTYDGFIKFFEIYFWGNAQKYFPQSAYNIDGNIKYEAAWLTGRNFSANPLRQSLGDHYSAERLWVRRRAVYCMSLFGVSSFGTYRDASLGRIQFRPISLGSMTLTPAESMYPCLIIGNDDIRPTGRTFGGEEYEFTSLVGEGNTVYTLQAVNYLTSLGDLKDLQLGNDDGGTFNLSGKKLREFKMGDADATNNNVTTTVVNLNITEGLPCLEVVDVRNAADLSGSLDLSECKRVKEVYTEGTKVSSVVLPRGSKVEKLHLSDYVTTLSYQVVKYLSDLVLPSNASSITLIYLEECDALDGMTTLYSIYNSTNQTLSFIRLVWSGEKNVTGKQLGMLVNIKNNKDKSGNTHNYNGVDQSGSGNVNINPHLEGLLVADKHYASDIITLAGDYEPIDSPDNTGMKRILAGYFGQLYIDYRTGTSYEFIEFAGPAERTAFVSGLDSNGDGGILRSEAANVTNNEMRTFVLNYICDNSALTSLDDLKYFTQFNSASYGSGGSKALSKLANVTSITLPGDFEFSSYSLQSCPKLRTWHLNGTVNAGANAIFTNSPARFQYVYLTNLSHWLGSAVNSGYSSYTGATHLYLNDVLVTSVTISSLTSMRQLCFFRCTDITDISLPSNITSIGNYAFYYCTALETLVIKATSVPTLGTDSLTGTPSSLKIYVPYSSDHSILSAYQAATNWSSYSANMYELDENGEIPTTR